MQREESLGAVGSADGSRHAKAAFPGLVPAIGAAILSAAGVWLSLERAAISPPDLVGSSQLLALSQVGASELAGALGSMVGGNLDTGQFNKEKTACPRPLAWLSLMLAPGQPPTSVRIQSGPYSSAVYHLSATPQRVAIPYPAPYQTGHGTLVLRKSSGSIDIALTPAWHVASAEGAASHEVTWRPQPGCKPGNVAQ